jgi:hypothetical protein
MTPKKIIVALALLLSATSATLAMGRYHSDAALLASGTSLAMAQNGDLAASSISGDLVLVRTPSGAAAYAGTTAPVIRHQHTIRHR